ncbi:stigma-specific STIG1-like protein 1 [Corylus avellana]|uniref:stigma-specific STIG1-like protein 1 n=1 Tax=Corylus avellana TaxID=13451 RepID=UPI001E237ED4|nr:stigma-specific STIG1-like protein 1 [Corylus avellana]
MKLLYLFFFLSAAAIYIVAALDLDDYNDDMASMQRQVTPLRGVSRFLALQNLAANMSCNKFPQICRRKSSPGPDCCRKKCVNVKADRLNCGMCGYKCKYTEVCCNGKCVNSSFDRGHCGGCKKRCKKGEFCVSGMCNYA